MHRALLHLSLLLAACASTTQGQVMSPGALAAPPPDAGAASDGGANVDGRGATRDAGAPGTDAGTLGAADASRGAASDFAAARAKLDRGEREAARQALEAFVAQYPAHPDRALAEVLLARLALARGDAAAAKKLAAPHADPADASERGTSARYLLGLAELRLGNAARARELLMLFLPKGTASLPPASSSDELGLELRGALAEATGSTDPVASIELWDSYFPGGREAERAWARRRATELAGAVPPEAAWRAWGASPSQGLARAVLGGKAGMYLREKGDASGASFVEKETGAARHALGFEASGSPIGPGDPSRIGLALPLSGKFQVVGEAALRAAMLASGAPAGAAVPNGGGPQLVVRDTATDPERAARGVAELTRGEAVIAIVGAASAKAGPSAIAQATEDGIAVLSLEDAAPGALTTAFQMIHAPEMRAAALARQAVQLGARRFAILGPDNAAGKRLREAFRRAVAEKGASVVVESSYVAGATSFGAAVAPLKKTSFDAVFVPDTAERLALVAPALAVADLWPQPWSKVAAASTGGGGRSKKGRRSPAAGTSSAPPRPILLLSSAGEVSLKLLEAAGRYVQGALLCPGFFADDGEPRAHAFLEAYRAAYSRDPHATEAYAYDAVAAVQSVVRRGARTRGDIVNVLGTSGTPILQGLTGNVAFGPDHGRIDTPIIYVIDGQEIHAVK
jgi:ABC-type branched-subunit amino acid transport system substrate-binding protein